MNKLKKIIFNISIIFLLIFSALPLFALRELGPAAGTDLTQSINQEKALQQQIIAEKKMQSQPRVSKPTPRSLPMPTKKELAARAASAGARISAPDVFQEL